MKILAAKNFYFYFILEKRKILKLNVNGFVTLSFDRQSILFVNPDIMLKCVSFNPATPDKKY